MLDEEAGLADELVGPFRLHLGRALGAILDADDVEASLDVILKDRLVVEDEEEDEEEEEEVPDPEERAEGATKVAPKRPDEFVCQSCFLVKHPSQLADSKKMLCRDCV